MSFPIPYSFLPARPGVYDLQVRSYIFTATRLSVFWTLLTTSLGPNSQ
jgi:hypothetical protein